MNDETKQAIERFESLMSTVAGMLPKEMMDDWNLIKKELERE